MPAPKSINLHKQRAHVSITADRLIFAQAFAARRGQNLSELVEGLIDGLRGVNAADTDSLDPDFAALRGSIKGVESSKTGRRAAFHEHRLGHKS